MADNDFLTEHIKVISVPIPARPAKAFEVVAELVYDAESDEHETSS